MRLAAIVVITDILRSYYYRSACDAFGLILKIARVIALIPSCASLNHSPFVVNEFNKCDCRGWYSCIGGIVGVSTVNNLVPIANICLLQPIAITLLAIPHEIWSCCGRGTYYYTLITTPVHSSAYFMPQASRR